MNKKLITALLSLTLIAPFMSHAEAAPQAPTIAIMDTGIDDTLPAFQGKILTEVCILEWTTCPNGTSFQESPHAAVVPSNIINLNGFDHGTQMASTFIATNPNANIVFIKIIGNTAAGLRQTAGEASVYNALNWVKQNATKYNIQAVSMSQGHHNLGTTADYCPKTPITEQAVKDLMSMQIPVFFPSGNGADYKRIDWPACIDASISVGATDRSDLIATNTNYDSAKLDFFATGYLTVASPGNVMKNIAGSSAAIQVAAAKWLAFKSAKPNATYNDILDALKSTASSTNGRQGTFNKLINLNAALSYVPGPSQAELAAAAKALLQSQVDAAIAAAEAQYQIELKTAQDKLAATRALWLAKLNG
jgi:hypothetical protein